MRWIFLLAVLATGCTDPVSCEALNARQSADALRTCVSSASRDDDAPVPVTLADGSVLEPRTLRFSDGTTVEMKWPTPSPGTTFDDGVQLSKPTDGIVEWTRGGEPIRRDSVGEVAGWAMVHPGGRYAIPLAGGRLLLRSRDGSDPVDLPIEVEWAEFGDEDDPHSHYMRFAETVSTAFSADGRRFAYADASDVPAVVDARTGERLWRGPTGLEVGGLALSPDGSRVALQLPDETVGVWDVDSGAEVGRWSHPRTVSDAIFGDDGSLIVWLAERSSTTTHRVSERTTAGSNQSYETTHETPPAIVVWRLP